MVPHANRRAFLKRIGAAGTGVGIAGLAGCMGDGDGDGDGEPTPTPTSTPTPTGTPGETNPLAGETLDVGVMQPVSGNLEYYGTISAKGFFAGLAYKFDVDPPTDFSPGTRTMDVDDGPTINLHIEDSQFVPETAQEVAETFVIDEEVDVLFGCSSSASARQVIEQVVVPTETPYIVGPAADENITANEQFCSPWSFRASEHTGMDARAGGVYAAREANVDQVAIFYADYAFGQSVRDNYRDVLEAEGITVSPVRGVPQGYDEFEGLFDEAIEDGAEAVIGGFTVATLPQFIATAAAYDIQMFGAFAELLTTQAMGQTIISTLGEDFTAQDIQDAGMGPLTTRYHWNQYDNPINDAFIDIHIDAYDQVPDLFSAGTFVGASALVQAMEQAESVEQDDIVAEMTGMSVTDTPKGEDGYVFREENNQATSDMTVTWPVPTAEEWAETWPAAVMPSEPVERFDAESVMTPLSEMTCDLS